eukprot:gene18118-25471_t
MCARVAGHTTQKEHHGRDHRHPETANAARAARQRCQRPAAGGGDLQAGGRGVRDRHPEGAGAARLRRGDADRERTGVHQGCGEPARDHCSDHRHAHQVRAWRPDVRPVHGGDCSEHRGAGGGDGGGQRVGRDHADGRADQAGAGDGFGAGHRLPDRAGHAGRADADPGGHRPADVQRRNGPCRGRSHRLTVAPWPRGRVCITAFNLQRLHHDLLFESPHRDTAGRGLRHRAGPDRGLDRDRTGFRAQQRG